MWRNLPLHLKMTVLIAALVVVTMLPLAAYTELAARAEIVTAIRAQSLQRARGTAQVLDTFLTHALEDARFLGTTPTFVEFLRDPRDPAVREQVARSIAEMRAIYQYDAICLADTYGTVVASTHAPALGRQYTTAPFFRSAITGQTAFDTPRYDPYDQQVYLHFSAPVRDARGIVLGALIIRIPMTALDQIIAADNDFAGRGDYGVLTDDLGIRLAHSTRPDLRFKPLAPLGADVANALVQEQRFGPATEYLLADASHNPELVARARLLLYDPTTDPYVSFPSIAAGPVVAALVPLTQQRWVYSIRTPEASIWASAQQQTQHIIVATFAVGIAAILATFVATRWVTYPLRHVADVANALAAGDTTRRAHLPTRDEIGQMATAFDAMADALIAKENELLEYATQLETRVAERTAELRASEEKYRALLNEASDAILLADTQGNWLDANRRAEKLLGYTKTQLTQMRVQDLHPPEEVARAHATFQRIVTTGADILRDSWLVRADQQRVPVEMSGSLIEYAGGRVAQLIVRDLTYQKQRERELHALATLAQALRAAMTRAEIIPIVLDQVMNLMDAPGANLSARDPVTNEIVVEYSRGTLMRATGLRMPPDRCVAGRVIATGQPYISNDAPNDPLLFRTEWLGPINAFACVPLITHDQVLGALWVGRLEPIGEEETQLLIALADTAASALRRAMLYEETVRLYDQTQQHVRHLTMLRAIDQAIAASLDLPVVLRVLLDQIITFLNADAADVLLVEPHSQTFRLGAARGWITSVPAQGLGRLGEGLAGTLAFERRSRYVPHLAALPNLSPRERALSAGTIAYLGAPLVAKGQIKGVLEIFQRQPVTAPNEWLEFLDALALQAAIAIDHLSLFEQLQRSNQDLGIAIDTMLRVWARTLEQSGVEPPGHLARVVELTTRLARAAGIGESELAHLERGALLHDIGKADIPKHILAKAAPLSPEEMRLVRQHPARAYEMLSDIEFLRPALTIPYCHHEWWDGSGYPRGLPGEAIPLAARVFAIVDVWDTVRASRPYGEAWDDARARAHLREQAGKQFDPRLVEIFFEMMDRDQSSVSG
jgi:PAS domain S-box-containing protein